jgi:hypothetical protein
LQEPDTLKAKNRYFMNGGTEVRPPKKYLDVFERVSTHDDWMFSNFPGLVMMRRYIAGEFWPIKDFGVPDKDVWVEVIRMTPDVNARHPLGVSRGVLESICAQKN